MCRRIARTSPAQQHDGAVHLLKKSEVVVSLRQSELIGGERETGIKACAGVHRSLHTLLGETGSSGSTCCPSSYGNGAANC